LNTRSKQILVIGGAGYIGAHTAKALRGGGFVPVTFDSLVHGHEDAVRWGPLERGDLADPSALARVFSKYEIAAVVHFAAYTYVGESVVDPEKYYLNNVGGTLNLLRAMRVAGVRNIIFSSTCATYGEPVQMPIDESHPQAPVSPYGWTKLMIERVLTDYGRAYDLRSICLRYFNASGADADGEIGERHDPEAHLIPLALAARAGGTPLRVLGDDYPTPDGTCIRDYIHVTDLARAHVLALRRLLAGGASAAYNLGNGEGASVREVLDAIALVTNGPVPHEIAPRRAGDPAILVACASKAAEELGWKPECSDLHEIVRTAWAWHQRGT
jgi:UDP-arabinose 4-epimerase